MGNHKAPPIAQSVGHGLLLQGGFSLVETCETSCPSRLISAIISVDIAYTA
jgi:hypothetical protein